MGTDIAIVGLGCVLPGAHSADAWIERSRRGDVALCKVPDGRWPFDPASAIDPVPGTPDKTPCAVGGFVVDHRYSGRHTPALPLDQLDPGCGWLLDAVSQCVGEQALVAARTQLWVASLALPSSGAIRAGHTFEGPPWFDGGHEHDLSADGAVRLVADSLDIQGGATALDAACASSLYAVQLACEALASGSADVAIAAGLQSADSAFLHLGFAQLLALSPSETPRPLDRRGDGLVVGEGAAAVCLKRLADARRDGDTVHGILRGGSLGNDGRSGNLLAPSASGQERTLRSALATAGIDAASVGYVECHATGTRKGDRTELDSLRAVYGDRQTPLVLGSTKGLIGHTITVAGLAGLIRAVAAVRDGVLPPCPWATEPLCDAPLQVLSTATPWVGVRRAAVSAFGFGGTNAHLIIDPPDAVAAPTSEAVSGVALAVVGVAARVGDAVGRSAILASLEAGPAPAPPSCTRGLGPLPEGHWLSALHVDARAARIPPTELPKVQPAQLLALQLAATAGADKASSQSAVILGMDLDAHVGDHVRGWSTTEASNLAPPLDASRVQGVLPNFVANRISARFGLNGPSLSVSAGERSMATALALAARLIATGAVDEALVGVSHLPGHHGTAAAGMVVEGGVVLRLKALTRAKADGDGIYAVLEPSTVGDAAAPQGALLGGLSLLHALWNPEPTSLPTSGVALGAALTLRPRDRSWPSPPEAPTDAVVVAHSHGPVRLPAFQGAWGQDTVPLPLPRRIGDRVATAPLAHTADPMVPLQWHSWVGLPKAPAAPPAPRPAPRSTASRPRSAHPPAHVPLPATSSGPPRPPVQAQGAPPPQDTGSLALGLARATDALTNAHAAFLKSQDEALDQISTIGALAARLEELALRHGVRPLSPPPVVPSKPRATAMPRQLSRSDLEHLASGDMSTVLGPAYADLDAIEPRVRLPEGPLLLVSRVLTIEGERGRFQASRMVTEYDLDADAAWNHDGRPPPCVVVESGQADLLLVAILGIDAETQGERVYRLLDCDLTFHGDRPTVGNTLQHDIRIERFAKLGATTLFYFEYDCTLRDGTPVLTMRNGVAGFFSPAALATPKGADDTLAAIPDSAFHPPITTTPARLDDAAMASLTRGDLAEALPALSADTSGLKLPPKPWGLLDRVTTLALTGGPHGLGIVHAEQDLSDDDWFNACHFRGDPCMPGTLMFDGCTQALSVWMMAAGLSTGLTAARFEPLVDRAVVLRCRGQIVPGHTRLDYEVRVKDAGLTPQPWAVADVVLHTNGTPIVRATDVGLRIVGERSAALPAAPRTVGAAHFVEHAVGSHERAYGPAARIFDVERRGPRIPGPPLQLLHRAFDIDTPTGELTAGAGATAEVDLPADAWWWRASPDTTLPLVILLEAALQPCGWFTAWAGAALGSPNDLYFRNLGGTGRLHVDVTPELGTLTTRATLTDTSSAGGMVLTFFDLEVRSGDTLVYSGDTHFGYFTKASLAEQKGLSRKECVPVERSRDTSLADWTGPGAPRSDLRMIDRILHADPTGGSAGLGRYAAELDVQPDAWFFTAHFHEDPVMPGSLGLEALSQLLRWAAIDTGLGEGTFQTLVPGSDAFWKYRGQVLRSVKQVRVALDIVARGDRHLVANGTVYADDLPIYRFDGFGCGLIDTPVVPSRPELQRPSYPPQQVKRVSALLDAFETDGSIGQGVLRLDPRTDPWLADHCPTLVTPAMPMAFAAELAAEAAQLMAPDLLVVGLPSIEAAKWLHTADGPVDVLVVAVRDGDSVAVSLAVKSNDGVAVHMSAVVTLASAYPVAPPVPAAHTGERVRLTAADYYAEGHTFHGPALQGMLDLGTRTLGGEASAEALFATVDDASLLPEGAPAFLLDPRLLDVATHPMMSSTPELWAPAAKPGRLAYPIAASDLQLYGPRPVGRVRCLLAVVAATAQQLVFDVTLVGGAGVWASFRWTEALVPGGLLGAGHTVVRDFALGGLAVHTLGSGDAQRWRLRPADLFEPLAGTLARLLCHPLEGQVEGAALTRLLAAKELTRAVLREHGTDLHPRQLAMLELRPGTYVVQHADLPADQWTRWLHPSVLVVESTAAGTATRGASLTD